MIFQSLTARVCSNLTKSQETDTGNVAQALEDVRQLSLAENLDKYGLKIRDALRLDPNAEKRIIIKVRLQLITHAFYLPIFHIDREKSSPTENSTKTLSSAFTMDCLPIKFLSTSPQNF